MERETFETVVEKLVELHARKNTDYGNAFGNSYQKYERYGKGEGLKYATGRIGDKTERLQNLAFSGKIPSNESVQDTLIDLAAYSIMTLVELGERAE